MEEIDLKKDRNHGGTDEAPPVIVAAKAEAVVASGNDDDDGVVSESNTVPRRVLWEPEHRTFTDKIWAVVYCLSYVAFLATGFFLVAKSKPRYEFDEDSNQILLSSYYTEEIATCCAGKSTTSNGNDALSFSFDLCDELADGGRRRLSAGSNSTFEGDEGIFDAFLMAPEIMIGLLSLTIVVALLWIVLLRFFATPVVFAMEVLKVAALLYIGVRSGTTGTLITSIVFCIALIGFDIYTRNQLVFAGRIMSKSAVALKENSSMFAGLLLIKLLFAANAYLFVLFFSKSFNVTHVELSPEDCYDNFDGTQICSPGQCVYSYPPYVGHIGTYLSLSYLWTIILFDKMRLSIIATCVGSWHFHPEHRPPLSRALINTLKSIGTLAVSALIATVAEKLIRKMTEPWWRSWLTLSIFTTLPLHLFLCCFGSCIKTFINILTKFSVILHVFTAAPFLSSGKKVFKIMKRHFVGGFVTENSSRGVLSFGAYLFSICIALLAWSWFDKRFSTDTMPFGDGQGSDAFFAIAWILFGLFNLWYPVLGIYIIILINRWAMIFESSVADTGSNSQDMWVAPLASIFVGCLSMMFFCFVAGVILDTVDTMFLCHAIDKDNGNDSIGSGTRDAELDELVKLVPGYIDNEETGERHAVDLYVSDTNNAMERGGKQEQETTPVLVIPTARVVTGIEIGENS